ncbi:hypothetical protein D3P07_04545 [Paenibacillus sp. 1011MAR3C5]|uniref:hypothetical protein n=1 Tax=Paenibacillus sp. 1011MAR3C5 TaxID=1675787 RepID=UPI000E6C398E|nr:hypothetical protein [Paenibacillus sp. 1011MAR3C5]RJE91325.1 hypothetical protein D3P07_04545 [Paenibacillus sp. 1011MAR3C5]
MTHYTRAIRGIERTMHYTKLQPVNRYAAYRLTSFEQVSVVQREDWNRIYSDAADSAAVWLRQAQEAQKRLDRMLQELGRDSGIRNASFVHSRIDELVGMINELGSSFRSHEDRLQPEVWEAVELALRHPAQEQLGIRRGSDGQLRWEGSMVASAEREATRNHASKAEAGADRQELPDILGDSSKLRRLLLGADGFIQGLKHALTFAEQRQSIDLLRLPFTTAYPYAMYYGAMQSYWPLPMRGVVLNKYY